MRSLIALIAAAVLVTAVAPSSIATARSAQSGMTVSGGDLPHPIELSVVDATAFTRRINDPPRFEEPPETTGPSYVLTTPYWATIEIEEDEDGPAVADEDETPLDDEAIYYPEGGLVEASRDGEAVWLVIDPRQQAIVDRYIRLGEQGLLPEAPSALEVLAQASAGEQITLEAGGYTLDSQETAAFWSAAKGLPVRDLDPIRVPAAGDDGQWLIVTLREGRSVQLFYDPTAGTLVDHLGSEEYTVSDALADVIAATYEEPAAIQNEDSPGSKFWWLVMAGGGVIAIALAVVSRRVFLTKAS
jgi:hypothetical protein